MSLVAPVFLSVDTEVGHYRLFFGVATPFTFSGDPQFSLSSRKYTESIVSMRSKGTGPLQGKPKITVEWCGHRENACLMDLTMTNILKLFNTDLYL